MTFFPENLTWEESVERMKSETFYTAQCTYILSYGQRHDTNLT